MPTTEGFKVYNIHCKKSGDYWASFGTQQRCREYMKFMKEKHFFDTGSMESAEEEYGEDSYYIEYGLALNQTSVASWNVNFSEWF
jgi:hypothetical protein